MEDQVRNRTNPEDDMVVANEITSGYTPEELLFYYNACGKLPYKSNEFNKKPVKHFINGLVRAPKFGVKNIKL